MQDDNDTHGGMVLVAYLLLAGLFTVTCLAVWGVAMLVR